MLYSAIKTDDLNSDVPSPIFKEGDVFECQKTKCGDCTICYDRTESHLELLRGDQ